MVDISQTKPNKQKKATVLTKNIIVCVVKLFVSCLRNILWKESHVSASVCFVVSLFLKKKKKKKDELYLSL